MIFSLQKEQPVSGLQKDGFGGFIKGVGKGIVG